MAGFNFDGRNCLRGKCTVNLCKCIGFEVGQGDKVKKCGLCGHPPGQHTKEVEGNK